MSRYLIIVLILLCGFCKSPGKPAATALPAINKQVQPKFYDQFMQGRAKDLGISEKAAIKRDLGLNQNEADVNYNAFLKKESRAMWQAICADCHSSAGALHNKPIFVVQPPDLTTSDFRTMLAQASTGQRQALFNKIYLGGKVHGATGIMRAFSAG